jgi:hypothetical protein
VTQLEDVAEATAEVDKASELPAEQFPLRALTAKPFPSGEGQSEYGELGGRRSANIGLTPRWCSKIP